MDVKPQSSSSRAPDPREGLARETKSSIQTTILCMDLEDMPQFADFHAHCKRTANYDTLLDHWLLQMPFLVLPEMYPSYTIMN